MLKTAFSGNFLVAFSPRPGWCRSFTKTLLVMKLTMLLLTVTFLNVHAKTVAQNVTLSGKDLTLKQVFSAVKKQTGFLVWANRDLFADTRPVSVTVTDMPLTAFLTLLCKDQPLKYVVLDRTIILSRKPEGSSSRAVSTPKVMSSDQPTFIPIRGKVLDSVGRPLSGATITIKNSKVLGVTDAEGVFNLDVAEGDVLLVSYVGYETRSVIITPSMVSATNNLLITLKPSVSNLHGVEVVLSTGYQKIPKERAAGSFFTVTKEMIDRRVSINLLQRLEDYVPGLIFQRDLEQRPGSEDNFMSIRGTSTIRSENTPLIVVDNFPYDGDIKNINPNDIENITILRDASAASIWGARAGNGVIVITTKSGSFNSKLNISVNSNIMIGSKPDPFHFPQMSMNDYVDAITELFDHGNFQFTNIRYNTVVPSLMQTLMDRRDGVIDEAEAQRQLNQFKNQDVRNDYQKYYYQRPVNRQLSLNLNGGGEKHNFAFNAGYDNNDENLVSNTYKRLNLEAKNGFRLLNNRLEINGGINIIRTVDETGNNGTPVEGLINTVDWGIFPFTQMADKDGNEIPIALLNPASIEDAMSKGLQDWFYYPLREIGLSPEIRQTTDYRLNASVGYTVLPGLKIEGLYQYWRNVANTEQLIDASSYTVRSMINTATQINPDGSLYSPIPRGNILNVANANGYSHNLRGQLLFNRKLGSLHEIAFLAGAEMRDQQSIGRSTRYYGYDDVLGLDVPVDYTSTFRHYWTGNNSVTIYGNNSHTGTVNRFLSQYGNASYTYNNQVTITGSFRRDASNIFGVETNNRVKPLWSVGTSWNIGNASFYQSGLLPKLKLRMSYGYNGNVNNSIAALLTGRYLAAGYNITQFGPNAPYLTISNPPNPTLRWEKVEITNIGIDFGFRNNRIFGSLEGYTKKGKDLIGTEIFPFSSGVTSFQGNFASTRTWGLDLMLNTVVVRSNTLSWKADLNLSYVNDKVTHFGQEPSASSIRVYGNGRSTPSNIPVVGKPMYGIYVYHWAGLDPENGDPRGYIDGKPSSDYTALINEYNTPEKYKYIGPGRPTVFGALRNSLNWKGLSLSANVSFRMRYFVQKPPLRYTSLTSSPYRATTDDFARRWQQPGDEQWTNVPSFRPELTGSAASNRTLFYMYSETVVERGDHIRLQDVMLSYRFPGNYWKPLRNMEVYTHANNLGILWKASKEIKDPDYRNYIAPIRTISFGVRVNY